MAPSNQYILYGSNATLNCSYADNGVVAVPTVERDDVIVVGKQITGANLADEGEYECDIFLPQHQASTGVPFTVHVIGELPPPSLSLSLFLLLFFPNTSDTCTVYC